MTVQNNPDPLELINKSSRSHMPRVHEEGRGGDFSGQASLKSGPQSQRQVALLEIVMVVIGVDTEGNGTDCSGREGLSVLYPSIF